MADLAGNAESCPTCGMSLRSVGVKTVKHLLNYELARPLREGRFLHCPNPECDTVYLRFSPENSTQAPDETFRRADIKKRAGPHARRRERLVCYCFGYTAGEIEDDARSGHNLVPSAITKEVRAGNCACEVMNPGGT